jgi:ADP-ribose pyrophosphatase YjhB (NUDIX family)
MSKNELPVTCGVIITDTRSYLICHPTMSKWWDIPKGKMEPDETYAQAAARELLEETGIVADYNNMAYLGKFPYRDTKQLALYYYQVDIMFDISKMSCTHMVTKNDKTYPEMDRFAAVTKEKMFEKLSPALSKLLKEVLK